MNRGLLSLCLINTLWHKYKKTYVDNFVPLMATTIINHNYHKIENNDIKKVMDDFEVDFGIPLKHSPTLTILQKCKKEKILRLVGKTYYTNETIARKFDLSKEIEENTYKQNVFLSEFKNFVRSELKEEISDDIVSSLVLNFIENNDVGLFLFSGSSKDTLLPESKLSHVHKRYKYLFDKFVSKIYIENRAVFRILVEIALGSIATNALLFSFANHTAESIRGTIIFLDTSVILRLIGVDEKENREASYCFLESIRSNGGILKIFSHTYEETLEVLKTSLQWVESVHFDPVKANRATLFFRQEGYTRSDIGLIISSLDRILHENNIMIEPVPDYTFENVKIDEKRLQDIFESELLKHDKTFQRDLYWRRTLRDIASICAISRLRFSIKYIRTVKEAKYLFITLNGALAYANYTYNKEFNRNKNWDIQECVSDVFLETYLWVNTPIIASTINSFKIKAVALSAIRPDRDMELALQEEAKKLLDKGRITEDDYILVNTSYLIKDLLSDKHFGDASLITESSIYSILDEVKERLIGDKNEKIDEINKKLYEEKQKREKTEKELREDKKRFNNMIIKLEATAKANAEKKSKRGIICLKSLFVVMILGPLLPAFFVTKFFLIMSGILSGITILLSFLGYTFDNIKENIYNKNLVKEREKLQLDSIEQIEASHVP
ncbi:MAG: hypothetical protein LBC60_07970 [Spirochaetaceae bacterium]|jgi:hypothetical protein|nr:hypothetical protein [Spirochaetaceae bacterium]